MIASQVWPETEYSKLIHATSWLKSTYFGHPNVFPEKEAPLEAVGCIPEGSFSQLVAFPILPLSCIKRGLSVLSAITLLTMKRIRCPKCDEAILFDETKYEPGRILVFECPECHKQFKIRIPQPKPAADSEHEDEESEENPVLGRLVVLENAFHFKQEVPLHEGDNVVGRLVKGSSANAPIKTVDPSVDTTHCVIHAKLLENGRAKFVLRDATSNTGTFLQNEILGPKDRVNITDGDIITIGATTMILREGEAGDED